MLFKLLWAFDAIVAAVFVYFFVVGLGDGSVSSFNAKLWAVALAVLTGVLGGGFFLNARGQGKAAVVLLSIVGVPGLCFGVFFLFMIIANPRWN